LTAFTQRTVNCAVCDPS